ncbi:MAG: anaerobic ribonucleoside-triphosphate reductase activating protein [bacterium]
MNILKNTVDSKFNLRGFTPTPNILVRGFIETSFLDWDGKVCSVVFLPYCNFRCPFCNNSLLVETPEILPEVKMEKIEGFLERGKDFIDGIVITGGEPTMHPWLPELIKRFRTLGFLIKLDTNGTNPSLLTNLLTNRLTDFVAMDLKAPLNDKYNQLTNTKVDLEKIKESIKIIMNSGLDYEFRTTVVPTLLGKAEIEEMAKSISNAKKLVLQQFVPIHTLDEKMRSLPAYSKEKLLEMQAIAKKYVPNTIVRGV